MYGRLVMTRVGIAIFAAVSITVMLSACAPSPESTYRADSGEEITVDWGDYPGHAGTEAEEVLQAPSAEDLEATSTKILGEIEDRLTDEFGLEWENGPGDGGQFFDQEGNGYGGDSLYVSFNSTSRQSLSIPSSSDDWRRTFEIVTEVTQSYGLGAVNIDSLDPDMIAENAERYGSDDPDKQWQWYGDAYGDSQWLSVVLIDVERDQSGKAADELKGSIESGWNPRSINISYGATTLRAVDRTEFIEAAEPFEGLKRPEATTSD